MAEQRQAPNGRDEGSEAARRGEDGPPTLPPPPMWRLAVAAAVIIGFLWFLYDYQRQIDEAAAPPAAPAGKAE